MNSDSESNLGVLKTPPEIRNQLEQTSSPEEMYSNFMEWRADKQVPVPSDIWYRDGLALALQQDARPDRQISLPLQLLA